jgi:hypothetical protein
MGPDEYLRNLVEFLPDAKLLLSTRFKEAGCAVVSCEKATLDWRRPGGGLMEFGGAMIQCVEFSKG